MKKRFIILSILAALTLSGCDILDNILDGDTPSEQKDDDKDKEQKTLESLKILGNLEKTTYIVGESWDTTGLHVQGTYSDESTYIIDPSEYTFSFDPDEAELDTKSVSITAISGEIVSPAVTYNVTVEDTEPSLKPIEFIYISGRLAVTEYVEGESWNTEGLTVTASFEDDTERILESNEYTLKFDPAQPQVGIDSVEIVASMIYEDFTSSPISFDVIVTEKDPDVRVLTKVEVEGELSKTTYEENSAWSSAGLSVKGYYSDNTSETLSSSLYSLEYNPSKAVKGTEQVQVRAAIHNSTLKSEYRTFNVTVTEDEGEAYIESIALKGELNTKNYDEGDKWDLTNFYVQATWSDEDTSTLNKNDYDIICSPSTAVLGTTSVGIYAEHKSLDLKTPTRYFSVTVNGSSSGGGDEDVEKYYAKISSTATGATLKTQLCETIKISSAGWTYDGLWDCYEESDTRPDGYLWDIYSDKTHYTRNSPHSGSTEGTYVNREHVIPQSSFNKAAPMKSDAHHVLPSDGKVNNMRGSYPHGIVDSATYTSNDGCKLGTGTGNTKVFEPKDCYKGDIARIYFYFVTCYEEKMSSNSFSAFQSSFPHIKSVYLSVYLKWHEEDPVSQKEIDRNNAIYAGQKNRNPFIDHPEYANRIWGN